MEKWLIWCDLNAEQDRLKELFGDLAVSIKGSMKPEQKIKLEEEWRLGDTPILITKPKIFSFGLNWQHCHNMAFVGLSDSFEQVFQAIRRCYRFGQTNAVNVHMITSSREGATSENIKRKEADFKKMVSEMVQYTKEITSKEVRSTKRDVTEYEPKQQMIIPDWLKTEDFSFVPQAI